jgi:excinuclease ABC subunit A
MEVIQRLVDQGNTVVMIEHNLDVLLQADHIIDLGPEGGDRGGEVVVTGAPEEVAGWGPSYTGQYIKEMLERRNPPPGPRTEGSLSEVPLRKRPRRGQPRYR